MCSTQALCVFLVVILFHQVTCKQYCIVPSLEDAEANSSNCLTLNQFATSDYSNYSNVTLMLEPGDHRMDMEIVMLKFTLRANTSRLVCKNEGRFAFRNVTNVTIMGVTFSGCEQKTFSQVSSSIIASTESTLSLIDCQFHDSSASIFTAMINAKNSIISLIKCDFRGNVGVIVSAMNGGNVTITECFFYNNTAIGGSRLISISNCHLMIIEKSNFTANTEAVYSVLTDVIMNECAFTKNYVPEQSTLMSLNQNYRGIVVLFGIGSRFINMLRCSFMSNNAASRGGIVVLGGARVLSQQRLEVMHNTAFEGAFVLISCFNATFMGETIIMNNTGSFTAVETFVYFRDTVVFTDNTASTREEDIIRGGAITLYFSALFMFDATVAISKNSAINGGGIHSAYSLITISTKELNIISNTADNLGGGLYLLQSPLNVLSSAIIANNSVTFGGGIYTASSSIIVSSSSSSTFHSLTISRNDAKEGGGIYFATFAHMLVYQIDPTPHRLNVSMTMNTAESGGALYVQDESNRLVCEGDTLVNSAPSRSVECFFQVVDLYPSSGNLSLQFESNSASKSGSVLFGGLLDRCIVTPIVNASFFNAAAGMQYFQDGLAYFMSVSNILNADSIMSDPIRLCFCFEGSPNCNVTQLTVNPQKGQIFNVSVAALDHVNHLMDARVFAELLNSTGGLGDGQLSQAVYNVCTNLTFSVTSTETYETIQIFADGPCGNAQRSAAHINVTFSDCSCPIGFTVHTEQESECECTCDDEIDLFVGNCTEETKSFSKTENVWIDYDNITGYSIGSPCPLDYCRPFSSTLINLNTISGADEQCANNRAGVLCGSCKQNLSLSLGQSGCISCGRLWPLYMFLILLAVLTVGTVLLCAILCLNITVAVGTLNGFIFSANILKTVFAMPNGYYQKSLILISILNLDVGFGINVCLYPGLSTYIRTWLELSIPIYLHLLIILVIVACKYSSRFANSIGQRNPVETLATMLLLSYSKLLQFVISVFSYVRIQHPNGADELVWLLDGRIRYGEPKHIAMIIAALIVFIIVFIYTFVLLFWQLLVKCPNWKVLSLLRNAVLIKAIELHHVPFNNAHRYWTGLLLLIRIIVCIVATSTNSSSNATATYSATLILLTLLSVFKTLKVRVYKKWPLDVLESILFAVTMTVTASVWYSTIKNDHRAAIATTSIMTAVFLCLLIGVVCYHVHAYILKNKAFPQKLRCVSHSVHKELPFTHHTKVPSQLEVAGDAEYPQAVNRLNHDRSASTLQVLGSPLESEYHELYARQRLQRGEVEEQEYITVPVQPTFSVLSVLNNH